MTNLSMMSENDNSTVLTEYKGLNKTETFYVSKGNLYDNCVILLLQITVFKWLYFCKGKYQKLSHKIFV